jgi:hypothetical protein
MVNATQEAYPAGKPGTVTGFAALISGGGGDEEQAAFGRRIEEPKGLAAQFIQEENRAHRNEHIRGAIAGEFGTVAGRHLNGGNRLESHAGDE